MMNDPVREQYKAATHSLSDAINITCAALPQQCLFKLLFAVLHVCVFEGKPIRLCECAKIEAGTTAVHRKSCHFTFC